MGKYKGAAFPAFTAVTNSTACKQVQFQFFLQWPIYQEIKLSLGLGEDVCFRKLLQLTTAAKMPDFPACLLLALNT